ncbi:hypothetical protein [Streptomyces sp. NPDC054771]
MVADVITAEAGDQAAADAAESPDVVDGDTGQESASIQERLQQAWARFLREGDRVQAVSRALALPSLRPYLPYRGGLAYVWIGTPIVLRSPFVLARLVVARAAGRVRTPGEEAPPDTAGEGQDQKPDTEKGQGPKRSGGKAPTKKAKKHKQIGADAVIGGVITLGMAGYFVKDTLIPLITTKAHALTGWMSAHPYLTLRAAAAFLLLFVPVTWIVGKGAAKKRSPAEEPRAAAEQPPAEEPQGRGEALLRHIVQAVADTEATGHTGIHLDAILPSAIRGGLASEGTEAADLRRWVEGCGLPVEPKFGRRVGGKPITRPGLRVDAVTKALGMPPAAWLQTFTGGPTPPPAGAPTPPPR